MSSAPRSPAGGQFCGPAVRASLFDLVRLSAPGPVAQWKSVRFTRGRSLVRSQPGPQLLSQLGYGISPCETMAMLSRCYLLGRLPGSPPIPKCAARQPIVQNTTTTHRTIPLPPAAPLHDARRCFLLVVHWSRLTHLRFKFGRLDETIPGWRVTPVKPKPCNWSGHCAMQSMK